MHVTSAKVYACMSIFTKRVKTSVLFESLIIKNTVILKPEPIIYFLLGRERKGSII